MQNGNLVIGCKGGYGAAYVYSLSNGQFLYQQKLEGYGLNGKVSGDYFGSKIVLSGNLMGIQASNQGYDENGNNPVSNAGAVYLFHNSNNTWVPGRKYVGFGTNGRVQPSEYFGTGIGLAPGILAAGNVNSDYDVATGSLYSLDKGSAFMFQP